MAEYRLAPKAWDDMEAVWLYSLQVIPAEACPLPRTRNRLPRCLTLQTGNFYFGTSGYYPSGTDNYRSIIWVPPINDVVGAPLCGRPRYLPVFDIVITREPLNNQEAKMLYTLDIQDINSCSRVQLKQPAELEIKEKHIEEFLSSKLGEIVSEDQLMLIGRERSFREEADLLALDSSGALYIFELKRWESNQENILQVMRYGQIFGQFTYAQLNKLAIKQRNLDSNYDLAESHGKHFELDQPLEHSKFNQDQVFVVITNGLDSKTISAVNYWSEKGIRIDCLPYLIYEIDRNAYIEFKVYPLDDLALSEQNVGFFIVNTCSKYSRDAWRDMIENKKASVYGHRRFDIDRIAKDDTVYLYHSGTGVIAKGVAVSDFKASKCDEEHFIEMRFDWSLDESEWEENAPKAREINRALNSNNRFRRAVFPIPEEMAEAIDKIFKDKKINETE